MKRKGTNNVFTKLSEKMKDQTIIGVGRAAHIIHNCCRSTGDMLPIDAESIIMKIYSYFYIYTVRENRLKEFFLALEWF